MSCPSTNPNLFSQLFFSKENASEINKNIRYTIFTKTGKIVGAQDPTELNILMKTVYNNNPSTPENINFYTVAISKLNELVVYKATEYIISAITSDTLYKKTLDAPLQFIDLPAQVNTPRYNKLEIMKQ